MPFLIFWTCSEWFLHTMVKSNQDKSGEIKLKKWNVFLLCLSLTGGSIGYVTAALNQPHPQADAYVLMDAKSGRVLLENENSHQPMKIASITKIMTAILAIESGKMEQEVIVSENAVNQEGSKIYLVPGEKILLKDLVYGLMLRSGNDAAMAIAEFVGGSKEGFVYLMNQKAQELGMKNTFFSNPSGLDEEGKEHYSSAYDMGLLTKYALENKQYKKIAGTKSYTCSHPTEEWDRKFYNKHKLVTGGYAYATTGKTGFTKAAGRTLVTTAEKGNLSLIVVTIRDGTDWKDHTVLFQWGFSNYQMEQVEEKGLKVYQTQPYYLSESIVLPLTKQEQKQLKRKMVLWEKGVHTPFTKIDGMYEIWLGEEKLAEYPIQKAEKKFSSIHAESSEGDSHG